MIKLSIYKTVILIAVLSVMSCAPKKEEHHASSSQESGEWPEMESFHMVMAEAYHPYKDSKNLEPIKSLAENLAKEGDKWANSALPEKMNKEEIKSQLEKLRMDARKLADLVKSAAPDEQIGAALSALHENFHAIMEAWHESKEPEAEKVH